MKDYLNFEGLSYFLNKLISKFVVRVDGKDLSSNDYTDEEKAKLSNVETLLANKSNIGHIHTAAEVGAVPTSRTVNGKSLSSNITLSASDVGADTSGSANTALTNAKSYTDTKIANLINGAPTTLDTLGEIATAMEDNADVVAALDTAIGAKANSSDLTSHTGNKSNPHGVTLSQLGVSATATELNYVDGVTSNVQTQLNAKVPTSRTVNGKSLSSNITLSASDVGADTSGSANTALTNAKSYTDDAIAGIEAITIDEINTICGTAIYLSDEVSL